MSSLEEAKLQLIDASLKRDNALERWPVTSDAAATSGLFIYNSYARDWKKHDDEIKRILNLYPELEQ